ncbi:MAG TPA: phosphonate metabolism protein/1,5-bisphosphokinase (PRPP-forming) PhnN [Devosia sp.]|nr:phosphonate metabolism protein/1,5-bisphosphokinase (PRPP-forming) PhnN [Devosia sp.]
MGRLVLVVGPSGAGKDTLINKARAALAGNGRYHFVRRVVTREADAGLEDHDTMSAADFERAKRNRAFALSWDAHGLSYGIPRAIEDEIAAGHVVVANGSRRMVAEALGRYPTTQVVLVDAPPEIRAARLAGRGRETLAEVTARLGREAPLPAGIPVTQVDNSGAVETALAAFLGALRTGD